MWSSVWPTDKRQRQSFHKQTLFYCFCETTTEIFPNFRVKRRNNKVVCPMPIIKNFFLLFTTVKLFIKRVWTGATCWAQKARLKVDEKFIASQKVSKDSKFPASNAVFFCDEKKSELHIVGSILTIYRLLWINRIFQTTNKCFISHISMKVNLQTK